MSWNFSFLAGISGINSNIKNCDIPQFGFFMWPLDLILASRQTISHILAHELECLELIQTYKSTLDKHIYWYHAHSISWASMWLIAWRADQFSVSECDRVLQKSHWDWVTVTLILVALYNSCFHFLKKLILMSWKNYTFDFYWFNSPLDTKSEKISYHKPLIIHKIIFSFTIFSIRSLSDTL